MLKFAFCCLLLGAVCLGAARPAVAQLTDAERQTLQENLQARQLNRDTSRRAYGALGVLGISLVPNETASTLSISTGNSDRTGFAATQFGGAFTVSESFPLYLEGFLGASRYDPSFILSEGQVSRRLPLKWTSFGGTIGVGWDFNITDDLVLRPIINGSYGHVESDISVASRILAARTNLDLDFIDGGKLNAYGYGGSLMLDYAHYVEDYEIDAELRYTHIHLKSFDSSFTDFSASSDAQTIALWSRLRVPTGLHLFDRPFRVVGELSASGLLGDQQIAIGSKYLVQLGAGVEFDIGAISWLPGQRIRLMGRYVYGKNVSGVSTGIGYSF